MKTYQLRDGDTLIFSVNDAAWETVAFTSKDFAEIGTAQADELVAVLNRGGSLAAYVDEHGALVLATASAGAHVSLDVDVKHSTAAASLGIKAARAGARGEGLRAAQLVSRNVEPFNLPRGGEMMLWVDGHRHRVTVDDSITPKHASAVEVARLINGKRKKVAEATRDGRVAITSNSVGPNSALRVEPPPKGKTDVAVILGFVGEAASAHPHYVAPARLACGGRSDGLTIINSASGPVELHLPTGTILLPVGGSARLSPSDVTSAHLQRLINSGVVRFAPAPKV